MDRHEATSKERQIMSDIIITKVGVLEIEGKGNGERQRFVEMTSDAGLKGYAGPLDGEYQFLALKGLLEKINLFMANRPVDDPGVQFAELWKKIFPDNPLEAYAQGKDPLTGDTLWQTHRPGRHTATGEIITALSAVDIALWDLRGKASGLPVYRMLGGNRSQLPAYISCMRSKTPDEALKQAMYWYEKGFKRHKCFLPFRPKQENGIRRNIEIVEYLLEKLPADVEIMYDLSRLSDQADDPQTRREYLAWACDMAGELGKRNPVWVEEPVSPDDIEGYEAVRKANPGVRISGGEHIYTRWNLLPFLEKGLLDVVQCDPEWCGGISEFIEISKMVRESYPHVALMPHGHMILAATQCVASQTETLTPIAEYLYQVIPDRTQYLAYEPKPEFGYFSMPCEPGIGPEPDPAKFTVIQKW